MSASPVDAFVSTVATLDATCVRTTPAAFDETLAAHLEPPAVGVPLDDSRVSLADADVRADPTPAGLLDATTGVTPAAFAIADYGSVVIPSRSDGTELVSLFVDRHVAVVDARDVVPDMEAAVERFGESVRRDADAPAGTERPLTSGIVATGPSATADMGALVTGAHGPSDVRVVVVEEPDG